MTTGKLVITVACADVGEARKIGRALVDRHLAACVQIVPAVESIYRWKGEVETAEEALLVIKSSEAAWERIGAEIRALHSYEVPEILALPVVHGLPAYLAWMDEQLTP